MGGHSINYEVEKPEDATELLHKTQKAIGGMGLFLVAAEIKRTDKETYELIARWSK